LASEESLKLTIALILDQKI